jgi:hypothetical protein
VGVCIWLGGVDALCVGNEVRWMVSGIAWSCGGGELWGKVGLGGRGGVVFWGGYG